MPDGVFSKSFQFILMYLSGKEHIERGGKGRQNLKGYSVYHIQAHQSDLLLRNIRMLHLGA